MQRKIFRIEQMERRAPAAPPQPHQNDAPAGAGVTLKGEINAVRATLADTLRDLTSLLADGKDSRMARAAGELGAAVEAMEKATDKILKSAETIDDCAKALAIAHKSDYERGLTQDIQEHVTKLYEACNFQDLAGQRIGKVVTTLATVEQRVSGAIARCKGGGPRPVAVASAAKREFVNGPRLDGDGGHASQRDIDQIFG